MDPPREVHRPTFASLQSTRMHPAGKPQNSRSSSNTLTKGAPNLRRTPRPRRGQQPAKPSSFARVKPRSISTTTQVVLRIRGDRVQIDARECREWMSAGATIAELVALVNGLSAPEKSW